MGGVVIAVNWDGCLIPILGPVVLLLAGDLDIGHALLLDGVVALQLVCDEQRRYIPKS